MRCDECTCGVSDVESLALYGRVAVEGHVEPVAGRDDRVRQAAAAEPTQRTSSRVFAVEYLQTVVRALHVRLQLEVVERLHRHTPSNVYRMTLSLLSH